MGNVLLQFLKWLHFRKMREVLEYVQIFVKINVKTNVVLVYNGVDCCSKIIENLSISRFNSIRRLDRQDRHCPPTKDCKTLLSQQTVFNSKMADSNSCIQHNNASFNYPMRWLLSFPSRINDRYLKEL